MATIPNPYNYVSPIGQALGNLTKTMLSGPSQAERIAAAETALKLKNTREATGRVADVFGGFGTPAFDRNAAMRDAIIAGYDPTDLAGMERYGAANTYGATDPRTDNAFVGAGGAYSSTAGGFREGEANQTNRVQMSLDNDRWKFLNEPKEALVNGAPMFVPQGELTADGTAPIMAEAEVKGTRLNNNWGNLGDLPVPEQRVLGADTSAGERKPFNVVVGGKTFITQDGRTDIYGNPIPPGGYIAGVEGGASDAGITNAVRTDLQRTDISNVTLDGYLDYAEKALAESPDENFGASGVVKNTAQEAITLAENLSRGLGLEQPAQIIASIRENAARTGVNPNIISGIFDPRLGKMSTVYGVLVYKVAGALAGQDGRDLSDADVLRAKEIVGDPFSLFGSKQKLQSKMSTIRDLLAINKGVTQKYLDPAAGTAPPAQGGAPSPVVKWGRDANGKPVRLQ